MAKRRRKRHTPEHERHEEFIDWSGSFALYEFDPKRTTREMMKGATRPESDVTSLHSG